MRSGTDRLRHVYATLTRRRPDGMRIVSPMASVEPSAETLSMWVRAGIAGAVARAGSTTDSPPVSDSQIRPRGSATTDCVRFTPSVPGRPSATPYS